MSGCDGGRGRDRRPPEPDRAHHDQRVHISPPNNRAFAMVRIPGKFERDQQCLQLSERDGTDRLVGSATAKLRRPIIAAVFSEKPALSCGAGFVAMTTDVLLKKLMFQGISENEIHKLAASGPHRVSGPETVIVRKKLFAQE